MADTENDVHLPVTDSYICVNPVILQYAYTHTHPFNGPFSGTAQVSRYQKGKTSLDFTEARDSEQQWNPLSAPRFRQITTPAPYLSVFYRLDAFPAAQPTASKL